MSEELERLEALERHGQLTDAVDQNALAELRAKAKKKVVKKSAPVKKAPAKKVSRGKAN